MEEGNPRGEVRSGLRVLVVDDDVDTTRLLAFLLEDWGYVARTAGDAAHAVRVAERFLPHVALLDLGLPGMDGLELGCRLRQIPCLTGVALIAVTGFGRETDWREAKEAGFDAYMLKPASPLDLLATIDRVLGARLPASSLGPEAW